jgi:hypothetical protein
MRGARKPPQAIHPVGCWRTRMHAAKCPGEDVTWGLRANGSSGLLRSIGAKPLKLLQTKWDGILHRSRGSLDWTKYLLFQDEASQASALPIHSGRWESRYCHKDRRLKTDRHECCGMLNSLREHATGSPKQWCFCAMLLPAS